MQHLTRSVPRRQHIWVPDIRYLFERAPNPILKSEHSNTINKRVYESTPAQSPHSVTGRFCIAPRSAPRQRRQASAQIVAAGRIEELRRSSSWVSIRRLGACLGTCFLFRRLLRSGGIFSLRRRQSAAWRGIPWVGRAWLGICHSVLFAERLETLFIGHELWGSSSGTLNGDLGDDGGKWG